MGDALADGGRWFGYDSDARDISRYVQARLGSALLGDTRRWTVLCVVLVLHALLWIALVRLMRDEMVPAAGPDAAIRVEFISPDPASPAPLIELSPVRRSAPKAALPAVPGPLATVDRGIPQAQTQAPAIAAPSPRLRLFRPDGSPNIADDLLSIIDRRTLDDGSMEYRIADLDRAGHFDVRPVIEYQASAFERYWIPSESLLEEWVRRGVTKVSIPIPGTHQRITCYTWILPPAASCGITSPRQMNDRVEADYVPPPNRNLRTQ